MEGRTGSQGLRLLENEQGDSNVCGGLQQGGLMGHGQTANECRPVVCFRVVGVSGEGVWKLQ